MTLHFKLKKYGITKSVKKIFKKSKDLSLTKEKMKASMPKTDYWDDYKEVPYKIIYRYLDSMLGKSYEEILGDLTKKIGSNAKYSASYYLNKVKNEFYINYKFNNNKLVKFTPNIKQIEPKKFSIYNHKHIKKEVFEKLLKSYKDNKNHIIFNDIPRLAGPYYVGKLWVSFKGNYMLLDVSVVSVIKFQAKDYPEECGKLGWKHSKLQYLQAFLPIQVCGVCSVFSCECALQEEDYLHANKYFRYLLSGYNVDANYLFIVKKQDIEKYKKEKL